MEDPFQQKRKESPYKDQNEEQGYILNVFFLLIAFSFSFSIKFFSLQTSRSLVIRLQALAAYTFQS